MNWNKKMISFEFGEKVCIHTHIRGIQELIRGYKH